MSEEEKIYNEAGQETHHVSLEVPLSGSKLFDFSVFATAKTLTDKYPPLSFTYHKNHIVIEGDLNDYWYDEYNKEVFYKLGDTLSRDYSN